MSDKSPRLDDLSALGARLRELRRRVGLSQMKLSEKLGFNPAHGYKYILRLEKGQVPNPTLRTIAAFLASCGAHWADVADVLPRVRGIAPHQPKPRVSRVPKHAPKTEAEPPGAAQAAPLVSQPRRRDGRPVREMLRQQRLEEKARRAELFWNRTRQAEQRIHDLLDRLHVPPPARPGYIDYARSQCRVFFERQASPASRSAMSDPAAARTAGLDSAIVASVKAICEQTWSQP